MTADTSGAQAAEVDPDAPSAVTADQTMTRIDGLRAAIAAGEGRLDEQELAAATVVGERARSRLKLSAAHTIVALAGATGSGKSSLFNELTGLDLAAIGVRRPTTSWATACAWDPDGAADVLDWLGIPARHQVALPSMLDTASRDSELDGLVLLDLPDHDSTEVSHHLEVDRLVRYADLIVWVLDPQKYADAALHERYLRPHSTHADVMFAVLNQVDRLSDGERADALADVHRLLAADGLGEVPVLATSTVAGDGLPELRQALIARLEAKQSARARVAADVATAAAVLARHGGTTPMAGSDDEVRAESREQLVDAVASATGLDAVPREAAGLAARRSRRAAGWPPLAQFRTGTSGGPAAAVAVDENLVDAALGDYVEQVGAGAAPPWHDAMRRGCSSGRKGLGEQLAAVSLSAVAKTSPPVWARLLGLLQLLCVIVAGGAVAWQLAGEPPQIAERPGGWLAAAVAAALPSLLAVVGGALAGYAARRRVERDALAARARGGRGRRPLGGRAGRRRAGRARRAGAARSPRPARA